MNNGSPKAIPSVGLNSKGTACVDASVKVAEKFQSKEEELPKVPPVEEKVEPPEYGFAVLNND